MSEALISASLSIVLGAAAALTNHNAPY
jgi:hypothetical protein